ncbi:MAG: HAD-IB family phosphatase [Myxococcales bacterium]
MAAPGTRPSSAAGFVVACDFDGTITQEDVTNLIWDRHLAYDWRKVLLPPSAAGEVTPLEMIARGYAGVHRPADALLAELRPQVRLREGFSLFHALCAESAWPFEVLSYGLSFYLRAFLPAAVTATAFEGTFTDGGWLVTAPAGRTPEGGDDFKVEMARELHERYPDHTSVYIGDGRLDFPAARLCQRIFAVRDSTLARMCRSQGIACDEFTVFGEVATALAASA